MSRIIVALDIGLVNFGLAIFYGEELKDFAHLNTMIKKKTVIAKSTRMMIEFVDEIILPRVKSVVQEDQDKDVPVLCVIESQPVKNRRCKLISHLLDCCLQCRGFQTMFFPPKKRYPMEMLGKSTYVERKKYSIDQCRKYLLENYPKTHLVEFEALNKKDDVADAILMALFVVK